MPSVSYICNGVALNRSTRADKRNIEILICLSRDNEESELFSNLVSGFQVY